MAEKYLDDETLHEFVRRITMLRRGRLAKYVKVTTGARQDAVEECIANNVLALHKAVLGAPTLNVKGSCYKPLKSDGSGYEPIETLITAGRVAHQHMNPLITDYTRKTHWLRIPGTKTSFSEPRLNLWGHDCLPDRESDLACLNDLSEEPPYKGGSVMPLTFLRDAGIHWLERIDVEQSRHFAPVASLNVAYLMMHMLESSDPMMLGDRVVDTLGAITEVIHCANMNLHVSGFATPDPSIQAHIEAHHPGLLWNPTTGADHDYGRVTLFIHPLDQTKDWYGRDRPAELSYVFALDII